MFKKLKDKLAEEVKSSPQRIQQFAQAAQAAVTSASSSISDITNNDLFSIGDNDNQQSRPVKPQTSSQQNTFQEVPLYQPSSSQASEDFSSSHEIMDNQRQRRLSNSSFASDVSFRLPSYESPSMYHLQSDMEISASEAEERGFSGGQVSLERVTKDQLYAAYRRTQERYTKYRTQYANLAHHYKLLERENAKARSVLVETQDKALRRISELREQCTLEQSAKAHLEKALRVDIEERNMKIEALNTQIALLHNGTDVCKQDNKDTNANANENEQEVQLINLAPENVKPVDEPPPIADIATLNNKIEKMEQLLNKYKESLKTMKEKNAQITTELQKMTNELASKNQESDAFKTTSTQLNEAKQQIHELNIANEELQNRINTYDFSKTKETSTLQLDLQRAKEEIVELNSKIDIFTKREEENAISLAENKLSIHKELESKESEIKRLKDHLSAANKELQSTNIIVSDYKNNLALLEDEKIKLTNEIKELLASKIKIKELESQLQLLTQKSQSLEQAKLKLDEEYKCLQLQMKQETAEKLATIDRNVYLEDRNAQLTEENTKKSSQISKVEQENQILKSEKQNGLTEFTEKTQMQEELDMWKAKYSNLESEIQEERDELVKLQSEIEKLLRNHELIQKQNSDLNTAVGELKSENLLMKQKLNVIKPALITLSNEIKKIKNLVLQVSSESKLLNTEINKTMPELQEKINLVAKLTKSQEVDQLKYENLTKDYKLLQDQLQELVKIKETTNKNNIRLQNDNENLTAQIQEYQELQRNYGNSQNELKETANKQEAITKELLSIKEENNNLSRRVKEFDSLHKNNQILQKELEEMTVKQEATTKQCNHIQNENEKLKSSLEELKTLKTEYNKSQTELTETAKNHNASVNQLQRIQKEYEFLNSKLHEYEKLQKEYETKVEVLENIKNQHKKLQEEFELTQEQNKKMESKLQQYQTQFDIMKDSQERETLKLNDSEERILKIRQECEDKDTKITTLEQKLEDILQDNRSLKSQSENIKMNAISLESEIEEVRRVHSVMESEKDRLNLIIEQLENKQPAETESKETQSENTSTEKEHKMQSLLQDIESLRSENEDWQKEISSLKDINSQLSDKILNQKVEQENTKDIEDYQTLNTECEVLRDENKRLQSDIEGLQIYMSKISKENSVLNDRLRELIASSENLPDKNDFDLSNVSELQKDINLGKQTIDDLLRENSLLIEENLELKDQIQSQNYVKPEAVLPSHNNNDLESAIIKEKYDDVLNSKKKLEDRVHDLEQINRSVNGNVQQMQDGNQKLRLANEKLERRLDEALVSLRHLHSLQENTELEYLRNILYEYLTGTGTHSITLAKVLAAVVKFDDKQTQVVLQKEKERQSVLRQLGLI